jgi:hypothetical protein
VIDVREKKSEWEMSGKLEGEIMMNEEKMRIGLKKNEIRWKRGEVKFVIESVLNSVKRERIMKDIRELKKWKKIVLKK